jgi:heme exporter protein A
MPRRRVPRSPKPAWPGASICRRALSAGQRRRVVLARLTLASARPLWVLDEPFNTLDVAATQWLTTLLLRQLARGGIVVLTSHQAIPMDDSAAEAVTVAL